MYIHVPILTITNKSNQPEHVAFQILTFKSKTCVPNGEVRRIPANNDFSEKTGGLSSLSVMLTERRAAMLRD